MTKISANLNDNMATLLYGSDGELDVVATMFAATDTCFEVKSESGGVVISWPSLAEGHDGRDWIWQSIAQAEQLLERLSEALQAKVG